LAADGQDASEGQDTSEGKPEAHEPRGGSADGAPGWAAPAEPGADAGTRSAAPKRADQQRKPSGGFGEDRRGSSASVKKSAAKKTSGGWSSRRKDRDPADADKPEPPQSREKLEQRAKNILMYHLGRQMQTRSQLAERLRKKEIPDDVAEAVLDRFEELHLLDDTSYAETFVRSRHTERGLAKRALGYELRKRGIDEETAAEALSTLDEDQEATTARRLVDSRLRATSSLDPQVRTRRLVGMLARKGYSGSIAFRVVKEALAEEGLDVDLGDPPGFD
jgi:regulatory protein